MTEEQRVKGIYRTTIVGSVVNLALVVCKFVAGFLGELISRNAENRNNYQIEKEI